MPHSLLSLRLTGATLLRDGELQRRSLAIADGRITKGPLPEVDLTGYLLLPGIIDLHGDAFERHIAPFGRQAGLRATDGDAAANGVTTAWMAQGWSWDGEYRSPDQAEAMMQALDTYRQHALTDLRLQLRCETHLIDSAPRLLAAIKRHAIGYVVFHSHIEDILETARLRPEALLNWAKSADQTPQAYLATIQAALARSNEVPRHLCTLADAFDDMGVIYGSHDDPDGETRERFSMIGARIAEFPTSRRAAAAARAIGDPVLMGAPNVVRGGSQSGNTSAMDLIAQGLCDALVSDDHYRALSGAAWRLVDDGIMSLPKAWAMISTRPAEIMRLPNRGKLDFGKRADVCVINETTRQIEMTISGGRISFVAGRAAHRLAGWCATTSMAAQ